MRRALLLSVAALAVAATATAQLKSIQTEHFEVAYFGNERYLAEHAARCFENALARHMEIFDYRPQERITILLHDFGDSGNAGASAVPNNRILVTIAPFSYIFEVIRGNERMNWLASHELVHILATDKASRRDASWRRVLSGKVLPSSENPLSMVFTYLTTPRYYAPRWYQEGIAVFMETWLTGGLGRALGAYDEMVFRTKVLEDATIYDLVGLESAASRLDFQVGVTAYLYGSRFMSYMVERAGVDRLTQWISGVDGRASSWSAQFENVYGRPVAEAWEEWIAWEREFQGANLDRLRANPVTESEPIGDRPLGSVSRPVADGEAVYVAVNYPGQVAHLAAIDLATGRTTRLTDVKGPALYYVASLALDDDSRTLFYTSDNDAWRDLRAFDLNTGRDRLLLRDGRVGDLAFNRVDRSLWGVRHYNGISTLVRIPPPYQQWKQVYSFDYGTDLYDIDISPDGSELSGALTRVDGSQSLVRFAIPSLLAGDPVFTEIDDFENSSPAGFVYSADGRSLYGSSYYSGVSNLYRVDVDSGNITPLTNADTGFFRPLPLADGRLLAFRFTSAGFHPVLVPDRPVERVSAIRFLGQDIVERHPGVRDWKLPPPSDIDLGPEAAVERDYRPFGTLRLRSLVPAVFGYKDSGAYGLRARFSDAIGYNRLSVSATYTPGSSLDRDERHHLDLNYSFLNWTVRAAWNPADFYDLFGPTKRSRKGYTLGVNYKRYLIYDEPNRTLDYEIDVAGWGDLETLPFYQEVPSTVRRLGLASISVGYKTERNSLGAVRPEKGLEWRFSVADTYARSTHFPGAVFELDLGVPLPIDHSSIWLRTAVGGADGDAEEPFANYFFGGFGNNWVDDRPYRRFHDVESFPGLEINEIGGRRFAKAMLEWNVPPVVFEHVGSPSLYVNWAALAVFAGGLVTEFGNSDLRREVADLGIQLDIRLVAATHHNFTLSLGYAVAFEDGRDDSDEFMASLKIPLYE